MNFAQVQNILTDLPSTFLRPQAPFTQWLDSLTNGLTRYASAMDALSQQVAIFSQARFGWLDIWGLLFNVPRFSNEADQVYAARIQYIITAGGGTPVGIATWIYHVWGIEVTVTESLPTIGYSLLFPAETTDTQIADIVVSLARVRPAGVPIINISRVYGGLYLETINFLDLAPSVMGAYLAGQSSNAAGELSAGTNNAQPILPTLFLTDPTLNPSLAV